MKKQPQPNDFPFTSTLERSENKLWGCHFSVPARIAKKLIDGADRRVVCRLNDTIEYQCGILHHEGGYVITVNKSIQKKLALTIGDEVAASLRADDSEYGLPMPDEFREVLEQDQSASKYFHALPPGRRRTLIYIASHVKNTDARIARALAIAHHLTRTRGVIDYRKLNEEIKQHRRM